MSVENAKRVSFDSPNSWELGGESIVHCELIPNPPRAGEETLVRLSHTNPYAPIDDVVFFIRRGDLKNPTSFADLNSAADWQPMELVEEIVKVGGREIYRSEAEEPFSLTEEVLWSGTFESSLFLEKGKNRIEIKVSSKGPIQSGVISDWRVKAS